MIFKQSLNYTLPVRSFEASARDEATLTLGLVSQVKRFAQFNETTDTLQVLGAKMIPNDIGEWRVDVQVDYLLPPFQTFKASFKLIVLPIEEEDDQESQPDHTTG